MARSRPVIILSAAISIDGKLATKNGDSKLSSLHDLRRVHKLRSNVDAILIGKNTLKQDDPLLTVRYVKGKNPLRIILDSDGTISSKSKILTTCHKVPTMIVTSNQISKNNILRLRKFPVELVIFNTKKINLKKLLFLLYKKRIKTLLVEGGGNVNWEFLKNRFVDKIIITVTPYILGGENAITFAEGVGFPTIADSSKFKLCKVTRYKNEITLEYSV